MGTQPQTLTDIVFGAIKASDEMLDFCLANVRLLDGPLPCRGSVGMWRLPEEQQKQVNNLYFQGDESR